VFSRCRGAPPFTGFSPVCLGSSPFPLLYRDVGMVMVVL
jgi:hypothetical protein